MCFITDISLSQCFYSVFMFLSVFIFLINCAINLTKILSTLLIIYANNYGIGYVWNRH